MVAAYKEASIANHPKSSYIYRSQIGIEILCTCFGFGSVYYPMTEHNLPSQRHSADKILSNLILIGSHKDYAHLE